MKPDLNKLETSALASIADQVLRRVDGYNHSKIGDLGDEIQELANENLKVIAYARELEAEKESLTVHFAEDNTALQEHIVKLEKELTALRNGEFDLRLAELQDENSSLKKCNNELEDSGTNPAMLNDQLQVQADRLEFLALRAHHEGNVSEGQLVTALGIPRLDVRDRIKIMTEIMSDGALATRFNRFEANRSPNQMMLEEYITARDALGKGTQ